MPVWACVVVVATTPSAKAAATMVRFMVPPWLASDARLRGVLLVVVDEFLQCLLDCLVQRVIAGARVPRSGLSTGDVAGEFLVDGALAVGCAEVFARRRVLHLQVHAHVG